MIQLHEAVYHLPHSPLRFNYWDSLHSSEINTGDLRSTFYWWYSYTKYHLPHSSLQFHYSVIWGQHSIDDGATRSTIFPTHLSSLITESLHSSEINTVMNWGAQCPTDDAAIQSTIFPTASPVPILKRSAQQWNKHDLGIELNILLMRSYTKYHLPHSRLQFHYWDCLYNSGIKH